MKSDLNNHKSLEASQLMQFGFFLRQSESDFSLLPNCSCEVWVVKLQWTEVASRTAGQNSNGEKADKASCFAQLYVTKVFSGTSPWSVFRVQSVLIQLSFCNKGGIPDMQGLCVTRTAAYIAELRRLL